MNFVSLINPYVLFKDNETAMRAHYLSSQIIEIMNDMADWAKTHWLPFEVTSTVSTSEEDGCLSRVSSTHRTGRAFDLSIHGWVEPAISEFSKTFNSKYLHLAAVGSKSGESELIVRHNNGNGDHIHVQIAKVFGVDDPMGSIS